MKKVISLLMSFVMLLSVIAGVDLSAYATDATSGKCGDSAYWNYNEDTKTLIISGSGTMDDYYRQEETAGFILETPWTKFCKNIKKISIGNNVTSIGDKAFYNCIALTSVTIGNSVTNIGYGAFDCCSSLTNVTIPNSVTSIGGDAFQGCSSLTNVTIPNSVTNIGDGAFGHCTDLTNVIIPDGVISIGDNAFYQCDSLTNVIIPDSVINIGAYAFGCSVYMGSSNLKSVTIGNSVTSIGNGAFYNCSSLTSVTIPNSVTSIGTYAFYSCDVLTSVTIGNSVTSIGNHAFDFCDSLTNVVIPDSVTSIGDYAFYSCDGLTSATIGKSVTNIGLCAFSGCSSLTSVIILSSETIPNSVTSIGVRAFENCSRLTSITIPNSVTTIKDYAFDNCNKLTDVYYTGTQEQWKKITIENYYNSNRFLLQATIHYNSTLPDDIKYGVDSESFGNDITGCVGDEIKTLLVYTSEKGNISSLKITSSDSSVVEVGNVQYGVGDYTTGTNEQKATVLLKLKGEGKATVTVTSTDGISKNVNVIVSKAESDFVEKYIDGYDFLNDSYSFKNCGADISKKYFTTLFGTEKGKLLYRNCHNAKGLCFGFAYTTGAILNNYPNVNTIAIRTGLVTSDLCKNIRDIQYHRYSINKFSGMFIGENFLSIEDYIKYAFIYQFSKTVSESSIWYSDKTEDDLSSPTKLLSLVKNAIDNNRVNVTIGMTKRDDSGGHRVLAVGYRENEILVDDPNNISSVESIKINDDGSWTFSGLENWNSDTCYLRSNVDIEAPYRLLSTGQTTTTKEYNSDNTQYTENYMEGINYLDSKSNLISISTNSFKTDKKLIKVTNTESSIDFSEKNSNLFWMNEGVNDISLSNFPQDDVSVSVAGNDSIISTESKNIKRINIDSQNQIMELSAQKDSTFSVSFEKCIENQNYENVEVNVTISGLTDSDKVKAVQTNSNINISGVTKGTVTMSINDEEVKSVSFNDNDGKLKISYDNSGESNKLEVSQNSSSGSTGGGSTDPDPVPGGGGGGGAIPAPEPTPDDTDKKDDDKKPETKPSEPTKPSATKKPAAVKVNKLIAKKNAIVVYWNKVNGVDGYHIQLATDKKFKKNRKSVIVAKQNASKKTVKKLKAKKKYYVRVRAYKLANGKKIYGKWSKIKSVKIK